MSGTAPVTVRISPNCPWCGAKQPKSPVEMVLNCNGAYSEAYRANCIVQSCGRTMRVKISIARVRENVVIGGESNEG